MKEKQSLIKKEWLKLVKEERAYLKKRMDKKDSKLNQLLEKKVPEKLQGTLDAAFSKAFFVVFEKGTGVIEKTFKKEELQKTYQINEYAADVRKNRKSLQAFSKRAAGSGNRNLLLSGVSGVGLGILGVGIPDIVLFTGLMLRSIYEIALNYGFDYQSEEEKEFILYLIRGALSYGKELQEINEELNSFIENGDYGRKINIKESIEATAGCLSKELLYMKFFAGNSYCRSSGWSL